MNRTIPALALFLCASPGLARADIEATSTECAHSRTLLAPSESLNYRQYAPDRNIDILHLALDVAPDFEQRTTSAKQSKKKPAAK